MPVQKERSFKNKTAQVKTLLSWKSPSRPFRKRDKDFFATVGAIVFLLSVILLFLKEWLLIGVILTLVFISYVLANISPEEIEHKITTQGIITGGRSFLWRDLSEFWFKELMGHSILVVQTNLRDISLRQIFLLLDSLSLEKVKESLVKYLPFQEIPEKTWTDRAGEWLAKKIPLEKT